MISSLNGLTGNYKTTLTYYYLSLSPSFIYNLPVFGLKANVGLDLEFNLSTEIKQDFKFQNPGIPDSYSDNTSSPNSLERA